LVVELSKNLHPDPSKRVDLNDMLEIYQKIFDEQKNWQFVNNLSPNEMIKLYDILDK
jgi:hypothetical protein